VENVQEVAQGGALLGVESMEAVFDVEKHVANAVLRAGATQLPQEAGQQVPEGLVGQEGHRQRLRRVPYVDKGDRRELAKVFVRVGAFFTVRMICESLGARCADEGVIDSGEGGGEVIPYIAILWEQL